jgi:glycosyltransferase involved in cell wall biosynthesis
MSSRQKRKNLLIIGFFGYDNNQLDGQTVKTRNIYRLVKSKLNDYVIDIYDTQQIQSNKYSILKLIHCCIKSHRIFYLPGQTNLQYFFLPLFFISKALRINLYYFAIGSWLPEFLQRSYFIKKYLAKLKVILVENKAVKRKLIEIEGFKNVSIVPNFRITNFEPSITLNDNNNDKAYLKVVFMGRIIRLKGLDTIFRAAAYIDEYFDTSPIHIDFYGPIDRNEKTWFYSNVRNFSFIKYRGVLEPEDIYKKISKYDVLILPTKYPGEGFPGSILDAYISGIPVIVSNYKYLSECVDEGESGFFIDVDDDKKLFYYLNYLYLNPKKLTYMKRHAYIKSKLYNPEVAWRVIDSYL